MSTFATWTMSLAYLIDNADAEVVVFHTSLGERVANVRERLPKLRLLVEVDDGGEHVEGAVDFETLLSTYEAQNVVTPFRRRSLHALHRRNDGNAERRDVSSGRPVQGLYSAFATFGLAARMPPPPTTSSRWCVNCTPVNR